MRQIPPPPPKKKKKKKKKATPLLSCVARLWVALIIFLYNRLEALIFM